MEWQILSNFILIDLDFASLTFKTQSVYPMPKLEHLLKFGAVPFADMQDINLT